LGQWIISPSAKNIILCKNGYIAEYPYYGYNTGTIHYIGYDLKGNKVWEKNENDYSLSDLAEKFTELNNEGYIWYDYQNYITQSDNGKHNLRYIDKKAHTMVSKLEDVDVVLNIEPTVFMNNDSLFILDLNDGIEGHHPIFISKSNFSRVYIDRIENSSQYIVSGFLENGDAITADTIQLASLFDKYSHMWAMKQNDKLFFAHNPMIVATTIDGYQVYDMNGNPEFHDQHHTSMIMEKHPEGFSYAFSSLYPVLNEHIFGYIPEEFYGKHENVYHFEDHKKQPIKSLNELKIITVDFLYNDLTFYIGSYLKESVVHNVIFDTKGDIIVKDKKNFKTVVSENFLGYIEENTKDESTYHFIDKNYQSIEHLNEFKLNKVKQIGLGSDHYFIGSTNLNNNKNFMLFDNEGNVIVKECYDIYISWSESLNAKRKDENGKVTIEVIKSKSE
jgi:hypothetical protein